MKMIYIKVFVIFITSLFLFSACQEKLQSEFGNSNVYFANPTYKITFQNVDTVNLEKIEAEFDSLYHVCAVYRSGIVDNLEEITVSLSIDSAYLDSVITAAQTALPSEMTTLMSTYKNSKALGAYYFSIPETVIIPKGERKIVVPFLIDRSSIKLYNNAKFNYTTAEYANPLIAKDKLIVLPIKITAVSSQKVLETQKRYYLQIQKIGNIK